MTRKRILALVLTVALCLALFASTAYIISNADHHCADSDCLICLQMEASANFLKTLSTAIGVAAVAWIVSARVFLLLSRHIPECRSTTLVSLKVKLSN